MALSVRKVLVAGLLAALAAVSLIGAMDREASAADENTWGFLDSGTFGFLDSGESR